MPLFEFTSVEAVRKGFDELDSKVRAHVKTIRSYLIFASIESRAVYEGVWWHTFEEAWRVLGIQVAQMVELNGFARAWNMIGRMAAEDAERGVERIERDPMDDMIEALARGELSYSQVREYGNRFHEGMVEMVESTTFAGSILIAEAATSRRPGVFEKEWWRMFVEMWTFLGRDVARAAERRMFARLWSVVAYLEIRRRAEPTPITFTPWAAPN